jgi:hypothetical protein
MLHYHVLWRFYFKLEVGRATWEACSNHEHPPSAYPSSKSRIELDISRIWAVMPTTQRRSAATSIGCVRVHYFTKRLNRINNIDSFMMYLAAGVTMHAMKHKNHKAGRFVSRNFNVATTVFLNSNFWFERNSAPETRCHWIDMQIQEFRQGATELIRNFRSWHDAS